MSRDWWDTLYADDTETGHRDTRDTTPGQDTGTAGRTVRITGRSGRLPDWRRGPRPLDHPDDNTGPNPETEPVRDSDSDSETPVQDTETGQDKTDTATPDQDETEHPDTRSRHQYMRDELKTDWTNWRTKHEDDQDKGTKEPPPWDPTRFADRILDAHRTKPIQQRAAVTGRTFLAAGHARRASTGRIAYAASAVGIPYWLGLTPWLTGHLDGAPFGVSIGLILIGWSIHRSGSRSVPPVKWCAHSLYACCVIAAFLHS